WDAKKELLTKSVEGHSNRISSVVFSPDGETFASAAWDGTVQIWQSPSGRHLQTLQASRSRICAIAFSPDGRKIAAAIADDDLQVWELSQDGGPARYF